MQEHLELLARIAHLYYKEDMTHLEIAQQIGFSRPKVTRLLQEARRAGIVRIEIAHHIPSEQKESLALQKIFSLQRAVVVGQEVSRDLTLNSVRRALASLIVSNLKRYKSIGFSFSRTIGNIADYIHIESASYTGTVCDLMGAMMGFPMPFTASAEVSKRIGGTLYPLSAPIMVQDSNDIDTYYADPNLKISMDIAKNVEFAVVGIGEFTIQNILYRSHYISENTISNLRNQGIVGEMCMNFFDINGNAVSSELDSRVLNIPRATLASAKNLTAVVSGDHKIHSLIGALRTGFIHTLVTDSGTAQKVLEFYKQDKQDKTDN